MDRMRRHGRSVAAAVALAALVLLLVLPASASAASTPLGKGKVVVRVDPFFVQLVLGGYPFYAVPPAATQFGIPTTPSLTLPITGGTWDRTNTRGTFLVKGGVDYIHYTTGPLTLHQLDVTAWHAKINPTAVWTAVANGTRIAAFDAGLTSARMSFPTIGGHKFVKVSNVALTYDAAFDTAFFNVFGVSLVTTTPFGTATLIARLK